MTMAATILTPKLRLAQLRDLSGMRQLERICFGGDAWGYLELAWTLLAPRNFTLLACQPERVIGLIVGEPRPAQHSAWISNLAVHPEYRRQGLGQRLLQLCEARLREPLLQLTVRASNEAAIALYKKAGYAPAGILRRYYAGGEDGIEMNKPNPQVLRAR